MTYDSNLLQIHAEMSCFAIETTLSTGTDYGTSILSIKAHTMKSAIEIYLMKNFEYLFPPSVHKVSDYFSVYATHWNLKCRSEK